MALNVTFIPSNASLSVGLPLVVLSDDNLGERVTVAAGDNSTASATTTRGVFRVTAVEDTHITIGGSGANTPTGTTGTLIVAGATEYFGAVVGDYVHTYLPS